MSCVLVDVDGTLVAGPWSCERLFIAHLAQTGVLGTRQLAAALAFPARWAGAHGRHVFKKNKAYLAGLAPGHVARLGAGFVAETVRPRLRPVMRARIAQHRARGDRIALLTGTPDFIARPLAAAVGAQAWDATVPALEGGVYGAGPPLAHPFGADKLAAAAALCARLDETLQDATAYADSVYDLPLLRGVGRAVAVHPDRRLARAARRHGWEILAG